jgi:putative transposase
MALTEHYYTNFEEGKYYHVYNISIDKKPMFKNDGNYVYFLKQFDKYISTVAEVYVYSLLINHFHFIIKIKNNLELKKRDVSNSINLSLPNISVLKETTHDIVSNKFRKFFQSYAMAFNKQQNRTGTLFQTPFKRALIDNKEILKQLVYYIHFNPQMHKLTSDYRIWKWSSFNSISNNSKSKLKKEEVLDLFDGIENFKNYHFSNNNVKINEKYIIEDELKPEMKI